MTKIKFEYIAIYIILLVYCFAGDTGLRGPVGERGIIGTYEDQGELHSDPK